MNPSKEYFDLLKTWTDTLLTYQLSDAAHPSLDGALLCPACGVIHGRCHDAIYPLLYLADATGEEKYLSAARKLYGFMSYMICDDGSLYNDSQSDWNGITVFSAIGMVHALKYHGHLLKKDEKADWETRLHKMALWLMGNITPAKRTNINYHAANAAAMALCGDYFRDESMKTAGRELADYVFSCVTEHGLVYGEGTPVKKLSPRGVHPIDIGYNVEETIPSLVEYAAVSGDAEAMEKARFIARGQLDFMLPDGAWDNSFGTRNFKWTYWGSRTSDGCLAAFNALGREEPVFAEAAYRNFTLMTSCTDGLLYGGPHYKARGELPCVHHSFDHIKVLAQILDEGVTEFERCALPSENPPKLMAYPECGTYRVSVGDWRATFTNGDFDYMKCGHVSGGAMTLLWHKTPGPVCASGNTDFILKEAHNQQLTRKKKTLGCVCSRIEKILDGTRYSQIYDYNASLTAEETEDGAILTSEGTLCDLEHRPIDGENYKVTYRLNAEGVTIEGTAPGACFLLPLIPREGITVTSETLVGEETEVFNFAPGFTARLLRVGTDDNGHFSLHIGARNK